MTDAKVRVTAEATETARRSWGEAFGVYTHRRVIVMAFLGFSAGLPFLLVFSTLSAWLALAEISRTAIGFFSWIGITYSIKVFWAPIVDRTPLPFLTGRLGKRRSWMLLGQIGVATGLLLIAVIDPQAAFAYQSGVLPALGGLLNGEGVPPAGTAITLVALAALLVAFSSATQDIVIDAYRIEAADDDLQGAMAAAYQLGYRIAIIVSGAGALYLAQYGSWSISYTTMAALMLVGMVTCLVIVEPGRVEDAATQARETKVSNLLQSRLHLRGRGEAAVAWVSGAVASPLADFFQRNGWYAAVILALVGLYRLSDITLGVMANPFYIDLGFTLEEIANVAKIFGVAMSIVGALIGGLLVARYGILKPLLLGAIMVACTNLLFAWLATIGPDVNVLVVTISADSLSAGLAGSSFIAYLSSLVNKAYTATQYALFSSLFTLPGKLLGGLSGIVVDTAGYVTFFIYASVLGLPAILLVIYFLQRARTERASEGYAA